MKRREKVNGNMIVLVGLIILLLLGMELVVAVGLALWEWIMETKEVLDRKKKERKDETD